MGIREQWLIIFGGWMIAAVSATVAARCGRRDVARSLHWALAASVIGLVFAVFSLRIYNGFAGAIHPLVHHFFRPAAELVWLSGAAGGAASGVALAFATKHQPWRSFGIVSVCGAVGRCAGRVARWVSGRSGRR
jgi:hypothetical protein